MWLAAPHGPFVVARLAAAFAAAGVTSEDVCQVTLAVDGPAATLLLLDRSGVEQDVMPTRSVTVHA
ncbi:MAG: hypothetical protein WKF64_08470 [Ilumatobacteraceae bacterium]